MDNDNKLGLVIGVGLVLTAAVAFFRPDESAEPESARPPAAEVPGDQMPSPLK